MSWAPDYITVDDLADFLRVDDEIDDVQFGVWCTAASRAVDRATGRQFGLVDAPESRVYDRDDMWTDDCGRWVVGIDDLMTTTGLTVNGTAWASVDAVLLPRRAPQSTRPWTALRFTSDPRVDGEVDITARWGWTTPAYPSEVVNACLMQANRFRVRRDSPYGIAGSPDGGSDLRLLARLDPDVAVTLAGLVRRRKAG